MGEVVGGLGRKFVARPLGGGAVGFLFCKLLFEEGVLFAELVVLLLETLGDVLESDVALDFALLVLLHASLELGELRLLAFAESTLCGSEESGEHDDTGRGAGWEAHRFWTRLPLASGCT